VENNYTSKHYYSNQQSHPVGLLTPEVFQRSQVELHKRNNVEATIFQFGYTLKNKKSKYRGLIKQKLWAYNRCLWINLVRIINFTKQTCQRTFKTMEKTALTAILSAYFAQKMKKQSILSRIFSIKIILSVITFSYIFS